MPDLAEKYPAFAQTSQPSQVENNEWDELVSGDVEKQPERIRMQKPENPGLSRRDALIRAGAGAVAGVLVAKGADKVASYFPDEKKVPEAPSANVNSASLEVKIMQKMTKSRRNNHKEIMRKYASAKIGRKDKRSRIEYATERINASSLPTMIKAILPYLPMQESNYKLSLTM